MVRLTNREKLQLKSMLETVPQGSFKARNIEIIMRLADGMGTSEVTKCVGIGRKTVWKIARNFEIFGIAGILDEAPRTGRPRTISGNSINTILKFPLMNKPIDSTQWTGRELARRQDIPQSTMYRFLNERGINVSDPLSIQEAWTRENLNFTNIEGLFLSPSASIIAFTSRGEWSQDSFGTKRYTTRYPNRTVNSFYRRTCSSILSLIDDVRGFLSSECGKLPVSTDVLIFLRILDQQVIMKKEIFLVTRTTTELMRIKMERFVANNPRFHLVISQKGWSETVKKEFFRMEDFTRMALALRLENLEISIKDWMDGPYKRHGVFIWMATQK